MEDIRLGRKIINTFRRIDLTAVSQIVLDRDPKRVTFSIWIAGSAAAVVQLVPTSQLAGATGLILINQFPRVSMNVKEYGDIVTKDWYGLTSIALCPIFVIEGRLEET